MNPSSEKIFSLVKKANFDQVNRAIRKAWGETSAVFELYNDH